MKARIKKTGEIINLANYATITLDKCDSWGNPVEMKPEEVELIADDIVGDERWEDVRERAAIAAIQGLIADPTRAGNPADYAEVAIGFADALVEGLKK